MLVRGNCGPRICTLLSYRNGCPNHVSLHREPQLSQVSAGKKCTWRRFFVTQGWPCLHLDVQDTTCVFTGVHKKKHRTVRLFQRTFLNVPSAHCSLLSAAKAFVSFSLETMSFLFFEKSDAASSNKLAHRLIVSSHSPALVETARTRHWCTVSATDI